MHEAALDDDGLLGLLLDPDVVLAGLDVELAEWHTLGAVGRRQDPAVAEDTAAAEVHQRQNGWQAPLKGHLVRKLAAVCVAAADDSGLDSMQSR